MVSLVLCAWVVAMVYIFFPGTAEKGVVKALYICIGLFIGLCVVFGFLICVFPMLQWLSRAYFNTPDDHPDPIYLTKHVRVSLYIILPLLGFTDVLLVFLLERANDKKPEYEWLKKHKFIILVSFVEGLCIVVGGVLFLVYRYSAENPTRKFWVRMFKAVCITTAFCA